MQNIRANLTFSNVVSLLCLFLLVGGGAYTLPATWVRTALGPSS